MSYSVYATDPDFYDGVVSDAVPNLGYRLNLVKGPSEGPRCNSIGYSDTYSDTGILLLVLV